MASTTYLSLQLQPVNGHNSRRRALSTCSITQLLLKQGPSFNGEAMWVDACSSSLQLLLGRVAPIFWSNCPHLHDAPPSWMYHYRLRCALHHTHFAWRRATSMLYAYYPCLHDAPPPWGTCLLDTPFPWGGCPDYFQVTEDMSFGFLEGDLVTRERLSVSKSSSSLMDIVIFSIILEKSKK